ncbi:succinyl-diaminopimelate desuccinylase [Microbacteriaceae bacterium SG_E_30_P1]|uniref:Probable succinyl-diaminopimelate desuccinylase n=1 Tax=Antiquaquibacter oligotrophicus TaxID=2880260 RepID=A0ABT6KMH1_9MICO|nr:ArgE/DapE family deacylase [Antiquaquibacter oligotrophicus]MDH6180369.1 succinyl-diaminopimelate desuccinylase [Antiquaquibacter oligotrophicus]UDF13889.1 ArgE/DapE family deacylase [Antiquaquibacter oligotrophicus]
MTADVVSLVRALIEINSVNPHIDPRANGEVDIAAFCSEWLARRGFTVERLEAHPGRPSVVAILRGTGGGQSLMLNGHLDTVGVSTYRGDAFAARLEDDTVFGRGAFDMKGGIAAILVAADRASTEPLRGDLIVALVADEEFGSLGTSEVLARFGADAAIVAEPSELELTLAHRGFAWFEAEFTGVAAHGSMPEQGVDAIAGASALLASVDELRLRLEGMPRHPLLGHGTVRVATISGGVDAATVAPSCTLTLERRTLPGETIDEVETELRALVTAAADSVPGLTATLTRLVGRGAFEADPASRIVTTVGRAFESVTGAAPGVRGEPFWTDAGLYAEAGIPCLVFGVDGGGAHADEEWVTVASLETLTDVLERTIREFCG